MYTASPAVYFLMKMSLQRLLTKTFNMQQVLTTGGLYRSEFEVLKAPYIMQRRVSYVSNNGETGGQQKKGCTSLYWKNKVLTKCFGKTSECYLDVSKVQLTFLWIQ